MVPRRSAFLHNFYMFANVLSVDLHSLPRGFAAFALWTCPFPFSLVLDSCPVAVPICWMCTYATLLCLFALAECISLSALAVHVRLLLQ